MQAPSNKLDAARGSGRKFLSRDARATDAEQMRFCLKIHNSKVSKIKKATSLITCQAKINLSAPVTSKPQFFRFGERFSSKPLIFSSRPGGFERFLVTPHHPIERESLGTSPS
jgi:hypothetical protein